MTSRGGRCVASLRRLPGLLLAACTLLVVSPLDAQQLPTRIFTEDDGLPSTEVNGVVQGQDGRLWFATRTGLGVYDGTSWQSLGPGDGLPFPALEQVVEDSLDDLWLVTGDSDAPVARRSEEVWRPVRGLVEAVPPGVRRLAVARLPGPYLGIVSAGGLAGTWNRGSWQPFEPPDSWEDPRVFGVEPTADGEALWLVGEGLVRIGTETATRTWSLPDSLEPPILGLSPLGDELWLVGPSWVGLFVPSASTGEEAVFRRTAPLPEAFRSRPVSVRIAPDGHGGTVVVDPDRILWIDRQGKATVLGTRNGLAADGATDVILDREGHLWIVSDRGVTKIRSLGAFGWDRRHGLTEDEVTAAVELGDGRMVLGHHGALSFLDGSFPGNGEVHTEQLLGLEDDGDKPRVMDLLVDDDGALWVATGGLGLVQRREGPGGVSWTDWPAVEGAGSRLTGLAPAADGGLWISGQDGVSRFDGRRFIAQDVPRHVRRIEVGPNGRIFAATYGRGLWVRELDGTWGKAEGESRTGAALSLYTILPLPEVTWVGGADGLYRLEEDRLVLERQPDVKRPVFSLMQDSEGSLWAGTDNGVFRWDGRGLRRFGLAHGLMGRETNRAALLEDSRGRVWVGTQSGITRFDPNYERPLALPRVEIVGMQIDGVPEDPHRNVRLDHDRNRPELTVRPLTLVDDEPLEAVGRLVGLEREFRPLENLSSTVRYSHLPPGKYHFEVKARRQGGAWGPTESSGEIVVTRPWWNSWAFRGLAFLVVVGLVWLAAWGVSANRYSRRLAGQVETRTAALEELTARLRAEIEERKRTETELRVATTAAEQASRAKSSFLAAMSHEIRTPMNGILGIVHLLEREDLKPAQQERIGTLKRSGEALLEILDDILDYSKIEAGGLEVDVHRFDLRSLVREVVGLFKPRAEEKSLDLVLEGEEEVPRWVMGDGSRLRQVLINLVGNAIKFTERGSVRLRAEPKSESSRNVVLRVVDSGIGIRKEVQWQLFQPFQQLESGHHRRHGGTGLGLAISHHLVTAMGGRIRVDSRPGEGSTFSLELSLPETEAPEAAVAPKPVGRDMASRFPMRILLAEDNPINRMIIVDMLEELGYRDVGTAENGVEVVAALAEESYDLILMDLQMPVLGGLATSRRIVSEMGEDRPRLVALTAHAFQADREACLEAGMDDHLPKPVSFESLSAALERWAPQKA